MHLLGILFNNYQWYDFGEILLVSDLEIRYACAPNINKLFLLKRVEFCTECSSNRARRIGLDILVKCLNFRHYMVTLQIISLQCFHKLDFGLQCDTSTCVDFVYKFKLPTSIKKWSIKLCYYGNLLNHAIERLYFQHINFI